MCKVQLRASMQVAAVVPEGEAEEERRWRDSDWENLKEGDRAEGHREEEECKKKKTRKKRGMKMEKKEGNTLVQRANSSISSVPTYSFKSIPFEI